jgi:predicted RNA-binding Zn-ribbon protein involved in translation (DUF1610 family)
MILLLIPHSTNVSCSRIWSLLLIQHWYINLMTLVDLHSDAGQVLCTSCGEPCILRTANTEANRGRKFYKCRDPGCGFFKYVKFMDPLYCIMFSCNVHILYKLSYLYNRIRVSIYYWSRPVSSMSYQALFPFTWNLFGTQMGRRIGGCYAEGPPWAR